MHILVIGGRGTLGNALCNKLLELGHVVTIIDILGEDYIRDELGKTPIKLEQVGFKNTDLEPYLNASRFMKRSIPELVIDVAEDLMIDRSYHESSFNTNITGTAHVLRTCAIYGIRCLLCTWKFRPPSNTSPLATSLYMRSKLTSFYNKGRAATQRVFIPHIINLDTPGSNFGSVLTRAYNALLNGGSSLLFEDGEYTHVPFDWISTHDVVDKIIQEGVLHQRSRNDIHIDGTLASFKSVIGIMINIMKGCQSDTPEHILNMLSNSIKNPVQFFEVNEGDALDVGYIRTIITEEITRINRNHTT